MEAEGVGNSGDNWTHTRFAIEVAEEPQVSANKAATQRAQASVDQGSAHNSLAVTESPGRGRKPGKRLAI
jgi:hypothetical protein